MNPVQVFDGAGPDPNFPVDEQGRPHGVWIEYTEAPGYNRLGGRTNLTKERTIFETIYEHGEIVKAKTPIRVETTPI